MLSSRTQHPPLTTDPKKRFDTQAQAHVQRTGRPDQHRHRHPIPVAPQH